MHTLILPTLLRHVYKSIPSEIPAFQLFTSHTFYFLSNISSIFFIRMSEISERLPNLFFYIQTLNASDCRKPMVSRIYLCSNLIVPLLQSIFSVLRFFIEQEWPLMVL